MSNLSLATMTTIRDNLNRLLGKDVWLNWELETISLELNMVFEELLRDKICVLQAIGKEPDLFYGDAAFFLYATEVISNKVADFEKLPVPTSLELAYSIEESKSLRIPFNNLKDKDDDIVDVISYILREEGYSVPVYPFDFIPKDRLEEGQTQIDTEAKKKAIELYIESMNAL